jgi:hypothetical protein
MTAQAASATYSLITYSNAYSSVQGSRDAAYEGQAGNDEVRLRDVLREAALLLMRYLTAQRLQAQRSASLRRAARESAKAEQHARECEVLYPAMAQELRAAAAHRMGQFD